MSLCTSSVPGNSAWKSKRKRAGNFEMQNTVGKSRKTANPTNNIGFESPHRALTDITCATRLLEHSGVDRNSASVATLGNETVTYVNNLFSPVNKLQAIPLTLGELRRRTEYPEFFGRSEMVAYLRHSKTTGNGLISQYNLKAKSKQSKVNVLSRLCESEARTLANGIHQMNSEYFPTDFVADMMKTRMENDRTSKEFTEEKIEGIDDKETINSTISMLQSLRKSLEQPDEEVAEDLEVFERATHTFGCQNIVNHIRFVESYLNQLQKKLSENNPGQ